jgi:hypothetical protein
MWGRSRISPSGRATTLFSEVGDMDAAALVVDGIECLQYGVYRVWFRRRDGSTLTCTARVSEFEVGDGNKAKGVNFETDEFGIESSKGFVDIKAICRAISAFHDAQGGRW